MLIKSSESSNPSKSKPFIKFAAPNLSFLKEIYSDEDYHGEEIQACLQSQENYYDYDFSQASNDLIFSMSNSFWRSLKRNHINSLANSLLKQGLNSMNNNHLHIIREHFPNWYVPSNLDDLKQLDCHVISNLSLFELIKTEIALEPNHINCLLGLSENLENPLTTKVINCFEKTSLRTKIACIRKNFKNSQPSAAIIQFLQESQTSIGITIKCNTFKDMSIFDTSNLSGGALEMFQAVHQWLTSDDNERTHYADSVIQAMFACKDTCINQTDGNGRKIINLLLMATELPEENVFHDSFILSIIWIYAGGIPSLSLLETYKDTALEPLILLYGDDIANKTDSNTAEIMGQLSKTIASLTTKLKIVFGSEFKETVETLGISMFESPMEEFDQYTTLKRVGLLLGETFIKGRSFPFFKDMSAAPDEIAQCIVKDEQTVLSYEGGKFYTAARYIEKGIRLLLNQLSDQPAKGKSSKTCQFINAFLKDGCILLERQFVLLASKFKWVATIDLLFEEVGEMLPRLLELLVRNLPASETHSLTMPYKFVNKKGSGHAMLTDFVRVTANSYRLVIYNTGEGIENHERKIVGDSIKYLSYKVYDNIQREQLLSSIFFLDFFHIGEMWLRDSHDPVTITGNWIYDGALNRFADKAWRPEQYLVDVDGKEHLVGWVHPQASGSCSASVMHALIRRNTGKNSHLASSLLSLFLRNHVVTTKLALPRNLDYEWMFVISKLCKANARLLYRLATRGIHRSHSIQEGLDQDNRSEILKLEYFQSTIQDIKHVQEKIYNSDPIKRLNCQDSDSNRQFWISIIESSIALQHFLSQQPSESSVNGEPRVDPVVFENCNMSSVTTNKVMEFVNNSAGNRELKKRFILRVMNKLPSSIASNSSFSDPSNFDCSMQVLKNLKLMLNFILTLTEDKQTKEPFNDKFRDSDLGVFEIVQVTRLYLYSFSVAAVSEQLPSEYLATMSLKNYAPSVEHLRLLKSTAMIKSYSKEVDNEIQEIFNFADKCVKVLEESKRFSGKMFDPKGYSPIDEYVVPISENAEFKYADAWVTGRHNPVDEIDVQNFEIANTNQKTELPLVKHRVAAGMVLTKFTQTENNKNNPLLNNFNLLKQIGLAVTKAAFEKTHVGSLEKATLINEDLVGYKNFRTANVAMRPDRPIPCYSVLPKYLKEYISDLLPEWLESKCDEQSCRIERFFKQNFQIDGIACPVLDLVASRSLTITGATSYINSLCRKPRSAESYIIRSTVSAAGLITQEVGQGNLDLVFELLRAIDKILDHSMEFDLSRSSKFPLKNEFNLKEFEGNYAMGHAFNTKFSVFVNLMVAKIHVLQSLITSRDEIDKVYRPEIAQNFKQKIDAEKIRLIKWIEENLKESTKYAAFRTQSGEYLLYSLFVSIYATDKLTLQSATKVIEYNYKRVHVANTASKKLLAKDEEFEKILEAAIVKCENYLENNEGICKELAQSLEITSGATKIEVHFPFIAYVKNDKDFLIDLMTGQNFANLESVLKKLPSEIGCNLSVWDSIPRSFFSPVKVGLAQSIKLSYGDSNLPPMLLFTSLLTKTSMIKGIMIMEERAFYLVSCREIGELFSIFLKGFHDVESHMCWVEPILRKIIMASWADGKVMIEATLDSTKKTVEYVQLGIKRSQILDPADLLNSRKIPFLRLDPEPSRVIVLKASDTQTVIFPFLTSPLDQQVPLYVRNINNSGWILCGNKEYTVDTDTKTFFPAMFDRYLVVWYQRRPKFLLQFTWDEPRYNIKSVFFVDAKVASSKTLEPHPKDNFQKLGLAYALTRGELYRHAFEIVRTISHQNRLEDSEFQLLAQIAIFGHVNEFNEPDLNALAYLAMFVAYSNLQWFPGLSTINQCKSKNLTLNSATNFDCFWKGKTKLYTGAKSDSDGLTLLELKNSIVQTYLNSSGNVLWKLKMHNDVADIFDANANITDFEEFRLIGCEKENPETLKVRIARLYEMHEWYQGLAANGKMLDNNQIFRVVTRFKAASNIRNLHVRSVPKYSYRSLQLPINMHLNQKGFFPSNHCLAPLIYSRYDIIHTLKELIKWSLNKKKLQISNENDIELLKDLVYCLVFSCDSYNKEEADNHAAMIFHINTATESPEELAALDYFKLEERLTATFGQYFDHKQEIIIFTCPKPIEIQLKKPAEKLKSESPDYSFDNDPSENDLVEKHGQIDRTINMECNNGQNSALRELMHYGYSQERGMFTINDLLSCAAKRSESCYRHCLWCWSDIANIGKIHKLVWEYSILNAVYLKRQKIAETIRQGKDSPALKSVAADHVNEPREAFAYAKHFKDPAFNVLESQSGITLRSKQIKDVNRALKTEDDGAFKSILLQRMMGSGKTSVLAPLLALKKADGFFLSVMMPPASLYKINAADLIARNMRIFGQRGHSIVFSRGKHYMDKSILAWIHNKLKSAINNGDFVVMAPETIQSMENGFIEFIYEAKYAFEHPEAIPLTIEEEMAKIVGFPSFVRKTIMKADKDEQREQFNQALKSHKITIAPKPSSIRHAKVIDEDSTRILGNILKLIRDRGAVSIDEIDMTFAKMRELNYSLESAKPLDSTVQYLMGIVMLYVATDDKLKTQVRLLENQQVQFLPKDDDASKAGRSENLAKSLIIDAIAEAFSENIVDDYSDANDGFGIWRQLQRDLGIPMNKQENTKTKIKKEIKEFLQFELNVIDVKSIVSNKDYRLSSHLPNFARLSGNMIITRWLALWHQLHIWIFNALGKSVNEHYGMSLKHRDQLAAKPFVAAKAPNETSFYASAAETLNKTFAMYLVNGIDASILADEFDLISHEIGTIARRLKTPRRNTPLYRQMEHLFKQDWEIAEMENNSRALHEAINMLQDPKSKELQWIACSFVMRFVVNRAFPTAQFFEKQISNCPLYMTSSFRSVQGYTGTIGNDYLFPNALRRNKQGDSTDEIKEALRLLKNKVVVSADIGYRPGVSASEFIPKLLGSAAALSKTKAQSMHAIIDIGAILKVYTNKQVAEAILETLSSKPSVRKDGTPEIKVVFYFEIREEGDQIKFVKWDGDEFAHETVAESNYESLKAVTGNIGEDEWFVYYDQRHCTGADFVHENGAVAIATIGATTTERDLLQGVMRMRKFLNKDDTAQSIVMMVPEDLSQFISKRIKDPSATKNLTMKHLMDFCELNENEAKAKENTKVAFIKLKNVGRNQVMRLLLETEKVAEQAKILAKAESFFVKRQPDLAEQVRLVPVKFDVIKLMEDYQRQIQDIVESCLEGHLNKEGISGEMKAQFGEVVAEFGQLEPKLKLAQIVRACDPENVDKIMLDNDIDPNDEVEIEKEDEQEQEGEKEDEGEEEEEVERIIISPTTELEAEFIKEVPWIFDLSKDLLPPLIYGTPTVFTSVFLVHVNFLALWSSPQIRATSNFAYLTKNLNDTKNWETIKTPFHFLYVRDAKDRTKYQIIFLTLKEANQILDEIRDSSKRRICSNNLFVELWSTEGALVSSCSPPKEKDEKDLEIFADAYVLAGKYNTIYNDEELKKIASSWNEVSKTRRCNYISFIILNPQQVFIFKQSAFYHDLCMEKRADFEDLSNLSYTDLAAHLSKVSVDELNEVVEGVKQKAQTTVNYGVIEGLENFLDKKNDSRY